MLSETFGLIKLAVWTDNFSGSCTFDVTFYSHLKIYVTYMVYAFKNIKKIMTQILKLCPDFVT